MKWSIFIKWLKSLFERKPDPKPEPDLYPDEIHPADIKWLGVNVGAWKKTHSLEVQYSPTEIIYNQGATSVWPSVNNLNGNVWIIAKINGQWYAATHEYMRKGYTRRGKNTLNMDHIERREFAGWVPQNGEKVGHLVSGLCRGRERNVSERTNIKLCTWR